MKEYTGAIAVVSMVIAAVYGFIGWIGLLTSCLYYGNVLGFMLGLAFFQLVIPWYGIWPFFVWFFILFFVGLPFYGIYKLFSK